MSFISSQPEPTHSDGWRRPKWSRHGNTSNDNVLNYVMAKCPMIMFQIRKILLHHIAQGIITLYTTIHNQKPSYLTTLPEFHRNLLPPYLSPNQALPDSWSKKNNPKGTNTKTPGKYQETHSQNKQNPPSKNSLNIIHLSTHPLMQDELRVLEKGLTFCPLIQMNTFEIIKDIHLIICNLLVKSLFAKKTNWSGLHIHTRAQSYWSANCSYRGKWTWWLARLYRPGNYFSQGGWRHQDASFIKTTIKGFKRKSSLYRAPSSNPNAVAFLKLVSKDIQEISFTQFWGKPVRLRIQGT